MKTAEKQQKGPRKQTTWNKPVLPAFDISIPPISSTASASTVRSPESTRGHTPRHQELTYSSLLLRVTSVPLSSACPTPAQRHRHVFYQRGGRRLARYSHRKDTLMLNAYASTTPLLPEPGLPTQHHGEPPLHPRLSPQERPWCGDPAIFPSSPNSSLTFHSCCHSSLSP